MVGDVNLFLPDGKAGDAECEIMIAGQSAHHFRMDEVADETKAKMTGDEVLPERLCDYCGSFIKSVLCRADGSLSLAYAVTTLQLRPTSLIARIGLSNTASINLFRKLGFGVVKVVRFWNEVEMRWGYPGIDLDAPMKEEEPQSEEAAEESEGPAPDAEHSWPEEERRSKDQEWDLRLPDGCTTTFDDPAGP